MLLASTVGAQTRDYTIDDILTRLESGAARIQFTHVDPAAARMLDSIARVLRVSGAGRVTTRQMAHAILRDHVSFAEVARWDAEEGSAVTVLPQPWFRDAVLKLVLIANGSLQPELSARLPRPAVDSILAPTDSLGRHVRELKSAAIDERLRHFRIKYGPGAPSLNVAEVALNYVGQWIPPFRSSSTGDPSRYEMIASYRPMELTLARQGGTTSQTSTVTAGQVGVRWYHWNPRWGTGNVLMRALRPSHASAGLYALAPVAKPLQKPWESGRRLGAFLGWGDFHAAYVFDSPRTVLIGTGKHIVPYAF